MLEEPDRDRPARSRRRRLDDATRRVLEGSYGADLSDVRVRVDDEATRRAGAAAFTIGDDVTIAAEHYRPGTAAGDAILAHEVAHALQQRAGNGPSGGHGAEVDADRSAVAAVLGAAPRGPRARTGLALQRCSKPDSSEADALAQLRAETDPARLERALADATDDQLRRLGEVAPDSGVQRSALERERAVRAGNFAAVLALRPAASSDFPALQAPRVLERIERGRTGFQLGSQAALREYAITQFGRLLLTPSGFWLVVELLATGRPVEFRRGSGGNVTEPTSEAGRLITQVTDPADPRVGTALPPSDQRRGAGSGSTITLDPDAAGNQVELGDTQHGAPSVIAADDTAEFGHELIHALHNARGENLSSGLTPRVSGVRDPVTGEAASPEELRTISGRTSFQALAQPAPGDAASFPAQFAVGPGVTENDLRADLGLPARATSHFGAIDRATIPRGATATTDALVARYHVGPAPVPTDAVPMLRRILVAAGFTDAALAALSGVPTLAVPHPQYVLMVIRFVERQPALADRIAALDVR